MKIIQFLRMAAAAMMIGLLATGLVFAQKQAPQTPFLADSPDLGDHVVDKRAAHASSGPALGPRRPPGSQSGQFMGRKYDPLASVGPSLGARSGQFLGRSFDPLASVGPNLGARSGQFMGRRLNSQLNLPGPNLGARSGTFMGPKLPSKR